MYAANDSFDIVKHDESVSRSPVVFLTTLGFVAIPHASAEVFFVALPNHAPVCVILDVHLP